MSAARQLQKRPDTAADTQTALNHGTRSLQRLSQLYVQRPLWKKYQLSTRWHITTKTGAAYNSHMSPNTCSEPSHKASFMFIQKLQSKSPPPKKTHTKNRWIKMSEAVVHIKWTTPSSFNKLTSVGEVCNSNHSSSCSPFQESVM